jgi:hypothetical protein
MKLTVLSTLLAGMLIASSAVAADWSDTYIGWRYGTSFAEPFETNDISKNIFNLNHVSGYKYGTNFFNVDMLLSDSKDPSGPDSASGARETYIVYRNTLSYSKISGNKVALGPARDFGLQFGFDWNTKDDAGYNSKKQMLVVGPTVSLDVPGFLDVGILEFFESNAPCNDFANPPSCVPRYHYSPHPALSLAWGIPLGSTPLLFKGYGLFIASKGTNEFGQPTAPETHFEVMLDLGKVTGGTLNGFNIGVEYEYWQNKFGNDASIPASSPNYEGGSGSFAHTPMVRAEYHF